MRRDDIIKELRKIIEFIRSKNVGVGKIFNYPVKAFEVGKHNNIDF